MNFQKIKYLILLSVVLTPILSGCGGAKGEIEKSVPQDKKSPDEKKDAPILVEVVEVKGVKYTKKIELPGSSVLGMETSKLLSRVGGYVEEIKKIDGKEIDIGSLVKKNTPLALIAIPELQDELTEKRAKVEQAKSAEGQANAAITQAEALIRQRIAEVTQAESHRSEKKALLSLQNIKLKRVQGLVEQGSIGEENLDEAKYAVKAAQSALDSVTADEKAAQANLSAAKAGKEKAIADKASATANFKVATAIAKRAETMVGFATVRAPFDGIITKRFVDHGAFVRPATSNSGAMPLFEVSRIDKVRVMVSVPNSRASSVKVGQKIVFYDIEGLPGVAVDGTVTRSSNTLDTKTRMMRIDIVFNNPVKKNSSEEKIHLQTGMYGTVSVLIKEWKSLTVVPVSAVQRDQLEQPYVIVVSDNVCHKKPVEIVFNDAKTVGIESNIKVGEIVVLNPAGNLKDGQKIVLKAK